MEKTSLKILVTGPYDAGKSTLIHQLSKRAVSIDALGTTVGFDFASKFDEVALVDLYIFGTPGHERFAFMQEILAKGSTGILLVVDSTYPETFEFAKRVLDRVQKAAGNGNIPLVVVANKQDLEGSLTPDQVRSELGLSDEIPVVGTVATTGEGVDDALSLLLTKIK